MRRLEHRRTALAGAVLAAICCVGYVGASFVAVAGAGSLTGTPAPAPTRATPDVAVGPKHASLGVAPATASISSADTGRSALVIAGLALASLMFLTVAAVPAAGTRFTSADRVLMYHRTGLLAAGVGTLLVTGLVFFIARGA